MGRRNPEKLKDKQRKQKAKRKLFTKQDVPTCLDTPSNDTVQEDYHGDSDTCTSAFGNVAIDIDVIDMTMTRTDKLMVNPIRMNIFLKAE